MSDNLITASALAKLREFYIEKSNSFPGLCRVAVVMRDAGLLNVTEHRRIKELIIRWMRERDIAGYIWPPFEVRERILWIDSQIKRLEELQ
jgi:hypothetical protein